MKDVSNPRYYITRNFVTLVFVSRAESSNLREGGGTWLGWGITEIHGEFWWGNYRKTLTWKFWKEEGW
jgi:hypothetical protein